MLRAFLISIMFTNCITKSYISYLGAVLVYLTNLYKLHGLRNVER